MSDYDHKILGVALLAGTVVGLLFGALVGWVIWPVQYTDTDPVDLRPEHKDDYVSMVSAAYALDSDLEKAKARLAKLEVDDVGQVVADLANRYISIGVGMVDIRNLVQLANALGSSDSAMLDYIATPTPTLTPTATNTPTWTPTSTSTATPTPTNTPTPTDTPTSPPPTPTFTPQPPTATPTPRPPTPTPNPPTATPVPQQPAAPPAAPPAPASTGVDYKVVLQRMLTEAENSGCVGMNVIFMKVKDIHGNPLNGVVLQVLWPGGAQEITTGEKGPGRAEWPSYGGYNVKVVRDREGPRTSEMTRWLDSKNPTVDDLMSGKYCPNRGLNWDQCMELRDIGPGQLCWGHYSYEVVFQRQW